MTSTRAATGPSSVTRPRPRQLVAACGLAALAALVLAAAPPAAAAGWDINPGVAKVMKDGGHERIALMGMGPHTPGRELVTGDRQELKDGVRYPDMPGRSGETSSLPTFLKQFLKAEDPKKLEHIQTAVARSHVGCLQYWHAMCPVAYHGSSTAGDLQPMRFTNADVRALVLNHMEQSWFTAQRLFDSFLVSTGARKPRPGSNLVPTVEENLSQQASDEALYAEVRQELGTRFRATRAMKAMRRLAAKLEKETGKPHTDHSDKPIAVLLHTVGDSYAPAHVVRDADGPRGCGRIHLFQGYTVQDSGLHGATDHNPDEEDGAPGPKRRRALQSCAMSASNNIWMSWIECKEFMLNPKSNSFCAFPRRLFEDIFELAEGRAGEDAGGSVVKYSSLFDPDSAAQTLENLRRESETMRVRRVQVRYTSPRAKGAAVDSHPDALHVPFADCSRPVKGRPGFCELDVVEPVMPDTAVPFSKEIEQNHFDLLPRMCHLQITESDHRGWMDHAVITSDRVRATDASPYFDRMVSRNSPSRMDRWLESLSVRKHVEGRGYEHQTYDDY